MERSVHEAWLNEAEAKIIKGYFKSKTPIEKAFAVKKITEDYYLIHKITKILLFNDIQFDSVTSIFKVEAAEELVKEVLTFMIENTSLIKINVYNINHNLLLCDHDLLDKIICSKAFNINYGAQGIISSGSKLIRLRRNGFKYVRMKEQSDSSLISKLDQEISIIAINLSKILDHLSKKLTAGELSPLDYIDSLYSLQKIVLDYQTTATVNSGTLKLKDLRKDSLDSRESKDINYLELDSNLQKVIKKIKKMHNLIGGLIYERSKFSDPKL